MVVGPPGESEPFFRHYYSQEGRVVVHYGPIPEPDSLENQLKYTYETKIGDIDGDTLQDIFVNRISGGEPGNGSLEAVILQNAGNGTFTTFVPNSTQLIEAASWQAAAIQLIFDDLNADGFLDILLKDLASTISGALDQMLFAPGEILSYQPQGTKAVDAYLKQFIDEVAAYQLNDSYFVDNAELVETGYWAWEVECELFLWGDFWEWLCYSYPVWVEYWYYDYSGFNADAVDVWEAVEDYNNGVGSYQVVWEIFESLFGVELASDLFCAQVILALNEIENEDHCKGLSISAALEAVRRSIAQNAREIDIQFGRKTGLVYITGHRVFKILPYHMAVEYRDPNSFKVTTISAACDLKLCLGTGGKLVSGENRPTDLPIFNTTVAEVITNLPPAVYFESVKDAREKYRDCLPYYGFPESTPETDYNSNGFVAGIVAATGGVPDFIGRGFDSMSYFRGGDTPVPNIEFTDQAPGCP